MQRISEENDRPIIDSWYAEAKQQTMDTINVFIKKLALDYKHDYGTICHAVAAAAVGAMYVVDKSPAGGITGFQAGAIQWEIIKAWGAIGTPGAPMKLVDYSNMLYPQYAESFGRSIDADTWQYLQTKAREQLASLDNAHLDVKAHWQSIVNGVVPFGYRVKESK